MVCSVKGSALSPHKWIHLFLCLLHFFPEKLNCFQSKFHPFWTVEIANSIFFFSFPLIFLALKALTCKPDPSTSTRNYTYRMHNKQLHIRPVITRLYFNSFPVFIRHPTACPLHFKNRTLPSIQMFNYHMHKHI